MMVGKYKPLLRILKLIQQEPDDDSSVSSSGSDEEDPLEVDPGNGVETEAHSEPDPLLLGRGHQKVNPHNKLYTPDGGKGTQDWLKVWNMQPRRCNCLLNRRCY